MLMPAAEREQHDFDEMYKLLEKHKPRKNSKYD